MDDIARSCRLKKRAQQNKFNKIIITGIVFLLIFSAMYWAVKSFEELLNMDKVKAAVVKEGILEEKDTVEAVAIRREKIISIPYYGKVSYKCSEGKRVRWGSLLLEIEAEGVSQDVEKPRYSFYSPMAGIVSFKTDGLEEVLTPGNLETLSLEDIYKKAVSRSVPKDKTNKPALKVVDNLSPVYLCFPAGATEFNSNSEVLIRLTGDDKLYRGEFIKSAGDFVLVKLQQTPAALIEERVYKIDIVKRREKGAIVPVSSLCKKDERYGIFQVSGNEIRWVEVRIKGIFEDRAVVNGIEPGKEIVVNPEIIRRGGCSR